MRVFLRNLSAATANSIDGLSFLLRNERAFRQEAALLVVGCAAAYFLAQTWGEFVLLVGSILGLMLVEALNTAIEQVCNSVTLDRRVEIKAAKDCGSAAVLIATVLCGAVWVLAVAGL